MIIVSYILIKVIDKLIIVAEDRMVHKQFKNSLHESYDEYGNPIGD